MSKIHPFQNAIESIVGELPLKLKKNNFPLRQKLENTLYYSELDDETLNQLLNYCCENASPLWATGEGILDAANLLVSRAFDNGNLEIIWIDDIEFIVWNNG